MRRYYAESKDPELIMRCELRIRGASAIDDINEESFGLEGIFLGEFNDDVLPHDANATSSEYGAAR
jgi:hypothetical protein